MIYQKLPDSLNNPHLVCAWPGIGMVGCYVTRYLHTHLKPRVLAEIDMALYHQPHHITVENGRISLPPAAQNTIYVHRSPTADLILFDCDVQPFPHMMYRLAGEIARFAASLNVRSVITFAGMPSNILHTDKPRIHTARTAPHAGLDVDLPFLANGIVDGMNGILLGVAAAEGLAGQCILAEIPVYTLDTENPQAGLAILSLLNNYFSLNLDFDAVYADLNGMESRIKKVFNDLSHKARKLMTQFDSAKPAETPADQSGEQSGLSLEDLQKRLRFSIPASARNRIEELFVMASADMGVSRELKDELDRWGVYSEYEDRFLSLFLKNPKDAGGS